MAEGWIQLPALTASAYDDSWPQVHILADGVCELPGFEAEGQVADVAYDRTAQSDMALPALEMSAQGQALVTVTGVCEQDLPGMELDADGTTGRAAEGEVTLRAFLSAGEAELGQICEAAVRLPRLRCEGLETPAPAEGSAALTLPSLELTGLIPGLGVSQAERSVLLQWQDEGRNWAWLD